MANLAMLKNGIISNVVLGDEAMIDNVNFFALPDGKWIGDKYDDSATDEERITALETANADLTTQLETTQNALEATQSVVDALLMGDITI